jgi:hypothetical protein
MAFCEYLDPTATNMAVEGLNEVELGDVKIKVTRASIGFTQASGLEMGVNAMSMFAGTQSNELEGARVLQLLNMVTAEDLIDNDDYEGWSAHSHCQVPMLTKWRRNLRRRHGRVPEVWQNRGNEDPASLRWQSTVCWRGQDIHEIRYCRVSQKGS